MRHSTNAPDEIIAATRVWLDKAVIGLNLCPFAKAAQAKNQIRYSVSNATDTDALRADLISELRILTAADPDQIDTTLLIHPNVLHDFLDYNDFLDVADAILEEMALHGQLQIASFHPAYQFAGSGSEDIENYTNRSPYPTLHLLRESSVAQAVKVFPDAADIYEKNIETLRRIGHAGWDKLGIPAMAAYK